MKKRSVDEIDKLSAILKQMRGLYAVIRECLDDGRTEVMLPADDLRNFLWLNNTLLEQANDAFDAYCDLRLKERRREQPCSVSTLVPREAR